MEVKIMNVLDFDAGYVIADAQQSFFFFFRVPIDQRLGFFFFAISVV